jgi:hypothetical protein
VNCAQIETRRDDFSQERTLRGTPEGTSGNRHCIFDKITRCGPKKPLAPNFPSFPPCQFLPSVFSRHLFVLAPLYIAIYFYNLLYKIDHSDQQKQGMRKVHLNAIHTFARCHAIVIPQIYFKYMLKKSKLKHGLGK